MARLTGDLRERTLHFGMDVLSVVAKFSRETVGWTVGKQLARSATSIGANAWEANAAVSEADLAGFGIWAAANNCDYGGSLVRRAERPVLKKSARGKPRRAINLRNFNGFLAA